MRYEGLNAAYKAWALDPSETKLNDLLTRTYNSVVYRYSKIDNAYDDIAQIVQIRVWRSLIGDLKPHDASAGDFAQYVAVVAVSERKKFYRSDRLVTVSENLLEEMQLDGELNKGFKSYKGQDPVEFETGEK